MGGARGWGQRSARRRDHGFELLLLDGVYVKEGSERRFVAMEPGPGDIAWLVLRIRRRVLRRLAERGLGPEVDGADEGAGEDEELFGRMEGAAMRGRIALGPRAGWRVERLLGEEVKMAPLGVLCAEADGFNVHGACG